MKAKNCGGMTLVEVIVASAILMVVLVPLSIVFLQGTMQFNQQSRTANAQQDARYAMELILRDLRQNDTAGMPGLSTPTQNQLTIPISGSSPAASITYSYDQAGMRLLRDGTGLGSTEIRRFSVSYVDKVVAILIEYEQGSGVNKEIQTSYRVKSEAQ